MKKILLAGAMVGSLLAVSCSASKSAVSGAAQAQKDRIEFLKLKGNWQITSVDYQKSFKIKPFDEGADAQCFVGSTWKLIPNNYTGSYTINGGGDCPSVVQPIKFEVLNGSQFQFKKIGNGQKAKNAISGYALTLVNQTDNTFTLEQNVAFQGEIVKVYYNFQKVN